MDSEQIVALVKKCSDIAQYAANLGAMNGVAQALLHAALRDQDPMIFRDLILSFEKPERPT